MTNNPITDAALAELDRLHAEAPPTPYYYGHDPNDQDRWNNEMWSNAEPNPSFFLVNVDHPKSGEVMAFVATLCNAYPALRQRLLAAESRLAEAERERDERTTMAARAQEAMRYLMNGLPTDDAVWAAYGNADSARAWLAARDAQQRSEGEVEAFNEMRRQAEEVGQQSGLAKKMCKIFADECIEQAAQRLRERGE